MRNFEIASILIAALDDDGSIDLAAVVDNLVSANGGSVGKVLMKTKEGRQVIRWCGYTVEEEQK